jgi:hypothetical protein
LNISDHGESDSLARFDVNPGRLPPLAGGNLHPRSFARITAGLPAGALTRLDKLPDAISQSVQVPGIGGESSHFNIHQHSAHSGIDEIAAVVIGDAFNFDSEISAPPDHIPGLALGDGNLRQPESGLRPDQTSVLPYHHPARPGGTG